jgi:hypothetical protein
MAEFTFFVDADSYMMAGAELSAIEQDLVDHGIRSVDIPTEFGTDLGERIPVRVTGSARGLRFYAKLLRIRDSMQLVDLNRVIAAAESSDAASE